jgi:hypothetical protein
VHIFHKKDIANIHLDYINILLLITTSISSQYQGKI